ncbi:hypothetical protein CC85DRAFT_10377 [Cutaneotrichosporon oleaginosum]|uniref:Uncharacterized protein n=1 Tax=Cutaneotrichosporon oleaginosum TaxID=879819 RepID=A0A0J0XD08_9TREE|nr:uncharacterized protein CC85DRAFT_10377 [Cutaneotrichosporon oleaginosum]KLT38938.1 hypothetical protein CC85DRAFT_10377 [Cutaneotrichosporon oleaginosum]TXT07587.1 hypothetical protein COLE_04511 [Cutaneotrichosporon oleaginosum]
MAFSSLADELDLDSGFPMSPSGPGLSLADEFGDMGGGGTLADELVDDLALPDYEAELEHERAHDLPLGLENGLGHPLEDTLGPDPVDKYGSLSRTPRRPTRGRGPRTPAGSMSIRVSRRLEMEEESDNEVDLAPLRATQAAGQRMLALLQAMDGPGSPSRDTSAVSRDRERDRVPLEERLAGHVARMGAAERVRDEQTREAVALVRDLDSMQLIVMEDDLAFVDALIHRDQSPRARRRPPALNFRDRETIREVDTDDEHERSPLSPLDHNSPLSSRWPDSPESPLHRRRPSSPLSPLSPSFPSLNGAPASPCLAPQPLRHRSTLAAATAELGAATSDAAEALNKLARASATAVQASAASGETNRQLRKLRVGVASLREGAEAEEAAQRGIDAWEASIAAGSAPDVRGVLAGLMAGFEERLTEMARMHEGLRRVSARAG